MKRLSPALVLFIAILLLVPTLSAFANSVPPLGRALIVQDAAPWGTTSNQQALTANGISFDVWTSAQLMANIPGIFNYHMIVFSSDQPQSYYNNLKSSPVLRAVLLKFVAAGRNLVIHAADMGWQEGLWSGIGGFFPMLLDVTHVQVYDGTNLVVGTNPVLSGTSSPITGSYASHDYFTNLPSSASVQITNSAHNPTYFVWSFGAGRVYASAMTMEFSYPGSMHALVTQEMYLAGH